MKDIKVNTYDVFVKENCKIDIMIFFDMPYNYRRAKKFIEDSRIVTILWLREQKMCVWIIIFTLASQV